MIEDLELRHNLSEGQVDELVSLYQGEWWSRERDAASVRRMLSSSDLIFAFVERGSGRLAAFARILTDQTYLVLVLDVIVASAFRRQGVGTRLVQSICGHPDLAEAQSIELVCQPELVEFYRKLGFTDQVGSSTLMRRTTAGHLTRPRGAAA